MSIIKNMGRNILWLLALLAILGTGGCGPTLKQLREMPSSNEKRISKDGNCVYVKTKGFAFDKQPHSIFAQLIWQSSWDDTEKTGEIFAMVEGYSKYPIIFKIKVERSETFLSVSYDPNEHLGRYKDIAMEIFDGADYSRCPEIKDRPQ